MNLALGKQGHTKKQNKMIRCIKRIYDVSVKFKFIRVVTAFNRWKFQLLERTNIQLNTILSDAEVEDTTPALRKRFLDIFSENEKLREVNTQQRKDTFKSNISIIFRSRQSSHKRHYFDIWSHHVKLDRYISSSSQRASELEMGLQQVESSRNYVKQIEDTNQLLRTEMKMTNLFFKWKSQTAMAQLAEERSAFEMQQKQMFRELRKIREVVCASNEQEVALLGNSRKCGKEVRNHLICLQEQLSSIKSSHTKAHPH